MLEHKIVVVSQRDLWEGDYRLLESLISGALVMTDPMSNYPLHIDDGVSIVVYHSVSELEEKILYYLSHDEERITIAMQGYKTAMSEHRSWHFMESLIFGNWNKTLGTR